MGPEQDFRKEADTVTAPTPDSGDACKPQPIALVDLAEVVYSAGKVFDGLGTGRLDTIDFLRSGSLEGVTSKADLSLLEDLRDVAQLVIDHAGQGVDAALARALNAAISRSGSLYPGRLRQASQSIGVNTPYGRHEPPAIDEGGLAALLERRSQMEPPQRAVHLFVDVARAQPFMDGNKRTALFLANAVLLEARTGLLLTIPVDENHPDVATAFSDLLARAYLFEEYDGVTRMLLAQGLRPLQTDNPSPTSPERSDRS